MSKVLNHVAKKERFHLPPEASQQIISSSNGNLRKALLIFEAMKMQKPDLQGDIEVAKPDWETYCAKIADSIIAEQTAQRLLDVRAKIYELLSHCIPPGIVLKVSFFLFLTQSDGSLGLNNHRPMGWARPGGTPIGLESRWRDPG